MHPFIFWGVFEGFFSGAPMFFGYFMASLPRKSFPAPKMPENFCLGSLDFYLIKIHVEYKVSLEYEFDNVTSYWLCFF